VELSLSNERFWWFKRLYVTPGWCRVPSHLQDIVCECCLPCFLSNQTIRLLCHTVWIIILKICKRTYFSRIVCCCHYTKRTFHNNNNNNKSMVFKHFIFSSIFNFLIFCLSIQPRLSLLIHSAERLLLLPFLTISLNSLLDEKQKLRMSETSNNTPNSM
jgi:hypothetical protein